VAGPERARAPPGPRGAPREGARAQRGARAHTAGRRGGGGAAASGALCLCGSLVSALRDITGTHRGSRVFLRVRVQCPNLASALRGVESPGGTSPGCPAEVLEQLHLNNCGLDDAACTALCTGAASVFSTLKLTYRPCYSDAPPAFCLLHWRGGAGGAAAR